MASHPLVFPCAKNIDWIIQNTNIDRWLVRNHIGEAFTSISSEDIIAYYRLLDKEETFNTKWLSYFSVPMKDILMPWWQDLSKFQVKNDPVYRMKFLKKVYHLIAAMMNQLYGRPHNDTFLRTWVPIMYVVATRGTIFNWASFLASALKNNIHTTNYLEAYKQLEFYIASYPLNVVCARCHFDN